MKLFKHFLVFPTFFPLVFFFSMCYLNLMYMFLVSFLTLPYYPIRHNQLYTKVPLTLRPFYLFDLHFLPKILDDVLLNKFFWLCVFVSNPDEHFFLEERKNQIVVLIWEDTLFVLNPFHADFPVQGAIVICELHSGILNFGFSLRRNVFFRCWSWLSKSFIKSFNLDENDIFFFNLC